MRTLQARHSSVVMHTNSKGVAESPSLLVPTTSQLRATRLTGKTEDGTVKLSAFNIRTAIAFAL